MSLQAAAQHLASQGRGNDSTLVHMSSKEVKSLQELAKAHGGSLSINPSTGLPEAGFLSAILPMVAGFALGPAGFGLTAMQAGLATGALGAVLSGGDLKKGLLTGLGAYGGAGLGESLAQAGMQEAGKQAAAEEAARAAAARATPWEMTRQSYGGAFGEPYMTSAIPEAYAGFGGVEVGGPIVRPNITPANLPPAVDSAEAATVGQRFYGEPAPWARQPASISAAAPDITRTVVDPQSMEGLNIAKTRGLGDLTPSERIEALQKGFTGENLMAYAKKNPLQVASMAAPLFMQDRRTVPTTEKDTDLGQRYAFSRQTTSPFPQPDVTDYGNLSAASGRERRYFTPMYTPVSSEQARNIFGFANGGTVEEMSKANAIGANTGYPQADIKGHAYSTPWQTPVSQNVVTGVADTGVNPMTGQMAFADGGYTYDPLTQTYNQPAIETPTITGEAKESRRFVDPDLPIGWPYMAGGVRYGTNVGVTPGKEFASPQTLAAIDKALAALAPGATLLGFLGNLLGGGSTAASSGFAGSMAAADAVYGGADTTSGIDAATGLQGQGMTGQTGLYGDAAAGMSTPGAESMGFGIEGGSYGGGSTDSGGYSSGSGEGEAKGGVIRGISHLGDYSDGGRLLRGPGDGVSDDIPAMIGKKQPARLADGEFVVPARIVSELGNGSTEAGARKLYAMMNRIQSGRKKTMGRRKEFAKDTKAERYLPA